MKKAKALGWSASAESERIAEADGEGHWREYKVGVLTTMASEVHAEDPCPELPATFADPGKMREIAREIKGFTTESQVSCKADEEAGPDVKERAGRPEVLVKRKKQERHTPKWPNRWPI